MTKIARWYRLRERLEAEAALVLLPERLEALQKPYHELRAITVGAMLWPLRHRGLLSTPYRRDHFRLWPSHRSSFPAEQPRPPTGATLHADETTARFARTRLLCFRH